MGIFEPNCQFASFQTAADALPTTIKSHKETIECKIYFWAQGSPKGRCAPCLLLSLTLKLAASKQNCRAWDTDPKQQPDWSIRWE